ncbi:hypothetical protein llap_19992 [Limosa lapponica baueri]|uniref:Uncharacterized protein n=1 Tax=Limosa lapponica baueri TaxID=1758121 RepID=A0A2I0T7E1_LIMLA|nr:hypothetical protein llap_19992 [Limosa lapponica baueri]
MGGHVNGAVMEDEVLANKPRKKNNHQQEFLLVCAVKSLRIIIDLIYTGEEWKGGVAKKIDRKVLWDPGPSIGTDFGFDVKENSSDFLHQLPPTCNVELG